MRFLMENRSKPAFTLIELLVVLSIIAILAVLLVPRLMNYTAQAREAAALQNAQAVVTAVELYSMDDKNASTALNGGTLTQAQLQPYLKMPQGADVNFGEVTLLPGGDVQGTVTTKNISVDLTTMKVVGKSD